MQFICLCSIVVFSFINCDNSNILLPRVLGFEISWLLGVEGIVQHLAGSGCVLVYIIQFSGLGICSSVKLQCQKELFDQVWWNNRSKSTHSGFQPHRREEGRIVGITFGGPSIGMEYQLIFI